MVLRLFRFFLVIVILLPGVTWTTNVKAARQATSLDYAKELLDRMQPEERIGQLFLVTFKGFEAGPTSQITAPNAQIYNLISKYQIGGVILLASNDNFVGNDQTLPVAQSLTRQLQIDEYNSSQQEVTSPVSQVTYRPSYIPLFIGITQEGDVSEYDQILSGLTPLPSQMAIGATWQPNEALKVGEVLGRELKALGVNLLLGPSLDVLQAPYSEDGDVLGVRTFGGDPFWVGLMSQAYITGVHQGSDGHMAVVAKHFPGFGGSDRLPEDEVATVRKSLDELKQKDLKPFFAVTGNAPTLEATTDAMLTSHIRYRGLQGKLDTTKPVSFDATAFGQLMSLPEFATWRQNGGVMVSDDLGSRAVRRFYDPTGQTFNSKLVARDAFLAGNDLLYLGDFTASGDPDSYTSIVSTLEFFTQKYREDPAFAQRVDESVLRILTLKYHLYDNNFSLTSTLPVDSDLSQIGKSGQVTFDVALQAATLINPSQDELADVLPTPPGKNDHIVFITDIRTTTQCSSCNQVEMMSANALEQSVLRLYSQGVGLVLPRNLISYTFNDLKDMLDAGTGVKQIENDIRQSTWIVVAMLDVNTNIASSLALRRFLAERPDLLQQKKIVAFAFNAPYFLGATDISKLTAYYCLYSRDPQFVDVAARLLFQEIQARGKLPVSVPGIGYDISNATFPDPTQTIPLMLDLPEPTQSPQDTATPTPEPTPIYRTGESIPVRTGVIVDYNGHPVPDETVVRFILTHSGDQSTTVQVEAQTSGGVARATLRVDRPGALEIRVESNEAKVSQVLRFDVPPDVATATQPPPTPTTTATQTPIPTLTPVPTNTPSMTPSPVPTITATGTVTPTPGLVVATRNKTNFGEWLLTLLIAAVIAVINYSMAMWISQARWGIRGGFLALIGGLIAYSYLALGLPGSPALMHKMGTSGVAIIAILGAGTGVGAAWIWKEFQEILRNKAKWTGG